MAYQSEADQLRQQLEIQKQNTIRLGIMNSDLSIWNRTLAEETLRVRDANQELRKTNLMLTSAYQYVLMLVIFITIIWNPLQ